LLAHIPLPLVLSHGKVTVYPAISSAVKTVFPGSVETFPASTREPPA
jgi:hypothetical protein